ncbi:MAG: type I methionyl aminopeptidase [Anaerolineae bacterium]|nr:type I methionyl aminopeptidase [Anaerolineae bacterium]
MTIDSENDLYHLKMIGRICAQTLKKMMKAVRPGLSTRELDEMGNEYLKSEGARSAPRLTYQFPGTTCLSVAPVIAHGIPNDVKLKAGDLLHIDVSAELDGYFADTGASVPVSSAGADVERLLNATRNALWQAIRAAKAGRQINVIGQAISAEARRRGYNTLRELTSHGVGHSLHDEPLDVVNYYNAADKRFLNDGLVLAIEPFLTSGRGWITEENDGWSLRTSDRAPAAQFEHTLVITKNEPIILTL